MENNKEEQITAYERKAALESSIFNLFKKETFYGNLVQELTIKYNETIPTAAIGFNPKIEKFEIMLNPRFFIKCLNNDFRISVLQHELLHFTFKHLIRAPLKDMKPEEHMKFNLAADMAINQYISPLPNGCDVCRNVKIKSPEEWQSLHKDNQYCPGKCVDVKDWKLDDGSLFPTFQTMDTYYNLIKDEEQKQKGNSSTKGNVGDQLERFGTWDEHKWEELDEETKQKLLDEAKKVLKRTIEKTQYSHSKVPDHVKDMLDDLEAQTEKLNAKRILESCIKKTLTGQDRRSTWTKPNRKYGVYNAGSKIGDVPNLNMYVDTSGSISVTELNQFLKVMNEFLKVGSKQCFLGFWHTSLYNKNKYRLNREIEKSVLESGGTDVQCVIDDIVKTKPNLSIILTDLYFDEPSYLGLTDEILFIVSKGGNKQHSLGKKYKVIYLEDIK